MRLPEELIVAVLNHTSTKDLSKIEQSSKDLKRIVSTVYKNRINEFLAYLKHFEIPNDSSFDGKVIKKMMEIGKNIAINHEKAGEISAKHLKEFYDMKDVLMQSISNLSRRKLKSKIPTFLLEMSQANRSQIKKIQAIESQHYPKVLISNNSNLSKINLKPNLLNTQNNTWNQITIEDAYRECSKIGFALPIGRVEVEERLKKVNQENVVVFRKSSRPGEFVLSKLEKGVILNSLLLNNEKFNNYSNFYDAIKNSLQLKTIKFLVEAEQEMKINPNQNKQKISLTEHQAL
jgi:hypothetical protein